MHWFVLAAAIMLAGASPAGAVDMFGEGYRPCGERPTTMEIVDCVQSKTKGLEARLNAALQNLVKAVDPPQREPLRKAQRLWTQFRTANCAFYEGAGSQSQRVAGAECVRAMTEDRAAELERAAVKP